jgi:hypothetical protein
MAAAAAEHSTVLQQYTTNTNPSFQVDSTDILQNSSNNLFNFLTSNSSQTKSSDMTIQNVDQQSFNSSVNSWFINALNQYSIANNTPNLTSSTSSPVLCERV